MQKLDGSAVQFTTSYFGVSVRSEAYYHGRNTRTSVHKLVGNIVRACFAAVLRSVRAWNQRRRARQHARRQQASVRARCEPDPCTPARRHDPAIGRDQCARRQVDLLRRGRLIHRRVHTTVSAASALFVARSNALSTIQSRSHATRGSGDGAEFRLCRSLEIFSYRTLRTRLMLPSGRWSGNAFQGVNAVLSQKAVRSGV
jgi:hypothetical protein